MAHDIPQGLTSAQAQQRLRQDGPNALAQEPPKPFGRIVWSVVREPMVLLLLAAGGVYLALGDPTEALMLLAAVVAVIALTLSQELRAEKALQALRDLSVPTVMAVRDGESRTLPSEQLVVDDIVRLREGERIPADALLLEGVLRVDESLLTGESEPQVKTLDQPELFAGTLVTQGAVWARVTVTGQRSGMGKIGQSLRQISDLPTPLQSASRVLIRRLAATGLVLSLVMVLMAWQWDQRPLLQSLLLGISLAMAILPEEIPVVLTVFLALGAWRLSRRAILTRNLSAVETLGAITVLAVDKTGTLTHNRMHVSELATFQASYRSDQGTLPESLHHLAEFTALATPSDPFDPMEKAIAAFCHEHLVRTEHEHLDWRPVRTYELSADILAMTQAFDNGHPGRHLLATKGAPEAIADLCHLDEATRQRIREQVEDMARRGLRVLGVARGHWSGAEWPQSQHDFVFEYLGLVGFIDPPREDAAPALAECARAGIRVVMMTGDHPATARAIGGRIGLPESTVTLTGDDMDGMDDVQLARSLANTHICARVKPHHKLRLVQVLQAKGEVVGMTGDGVNDAPALRAANVGIAMGQRGTDVAREAADVILLDDSFANIIAGVAQGRLIDHNLRRAMAFVFAVHVPVVLLAFAPVALHWPILLLPAQIVLLELIIDPACSVYFEAERAPAHMMSQPPRRATHTALALPVVISGLLRGLLASSVLLVAMVWLQAASPSAEQLRTTMFLALTATLLVLMHDPSHRPAPATPGSAANPWRLRIGLGVAGLLALVLGVPPVRHAMGLTPPELPMLLTVAALALLQWGLSWVFFRRP
jgi:P-type Ca2+ transporter type 2C